MSASATILITTKDRKQELRRALESAMTQEGKPEILVFDDGSSDGTSEMVREEFPGVRCERTDRPLGIVNARNRAVGMATGSIVITIDDDCVFQSSQTVIRTLADFENSRIGAVAIPHKNGVSSPVIHSCPDDRGVWITSEFTGCASAVRRELFISLGGFNRNLWRQAEELDFCTRMLDAGYVTRCGTCWPILHLPSPNRDRNLIQKHAMRSNLLYCWRNVPGAFLPVHAAGTVWKTMAFGVSQKLFAPSFQGLCAGLRAISANARTRRPVSKTAYRLMRRLRRNGPLPLECIEPFLPDVV